jgi:hypothetical protein
MPGGGKFERTGLGSDRDAKESSMAIMGEISISGTKIKCGGCGI